jgi:hypothetical protein
MATKRKKSSDTSDTNSDDSRDIAEYRRTNDSIGLKVVEGQFSLLSRKLYNVFISAAQKQQRPGLNAPTDDPSAEGYFWIQLQDVVKDTRYNSNDYQTLKEHAKEIENIRVESESTNMWTSERLLSGVKIFNSHGLRSKGGTVWLGFAFPPEVMHAVLKPTIYTKFNLWYQAQLRTSSSLALYEVCRRYASSPSHLTNRDKWESWFYTITGTVTSDTNLPEYKYFKRDHVLKAISEINVVTDIDVELIEYKEGRRVAEIQFKVYQKAQASFELPLAPIINMAVIQRIMALGISKEESSIIYSSYDENVVIAHLDYVEGRQKNSSIQPLDSPAAYFKSAIKKGYANPIDLEAAVVEPLPEKNKKKKNLRERFMIARSKDALTSYNKLEAEIQRDLFDRFSEKADKSIKPYLKKGMEMKLVKNAFADWLATEFWGEPTDSQILDFLESETDE